MFKKEKNSSLVENAIKEKNLESTITFGKYKGKTVHEVLHLDPSYLVWAHNTISWFKLNDLIYQQVLMSANEELGKRIRQNRRYDYIGDEMDYYDFCD